MSWNSGYDFSTCLPRLQAEMSRRSYYYAYVENQITRTLSPYERFAYHL